MACAASLEPPGKISIPLAPGLGWERKMWLSEDVGLLRSKGFFRDV